MIDDLEWIVGVFASYVCEWIHEFMLSILIFKFHEEISIQIDKLWHSLGTLPENVIEFWINLCTFVEGGWSNIKAHGANTICEHQTSFKLQVKQAPRLICKLDLSDVTYRPTTHAKLTAPKNHLLERPERFRRSPTILLTALVPKSHWSLPTSGFLVKIV